MQVFTIKLSAVSTPKYENIWIAILTLVWFGENYLDCESAVIQVNQVKSSKFLANEIYWQARMKLKLKIAYELLMVFAKLTFYLRLSPWNQWRSADI